MANAQHERARKNFTKAGKDSAVRAQQRVCGTETVDGPCRAQGLYTETFRGTAYHFEGTCELGHETERYGYADKAVKD
jgi:hypothetical protein